jgi:hypothetical protein
MKSTIAAVTLNPGKSVSVFQNVQTGSGPTQPSIQRVPVALTEGIKRLGRETEHWLVCSIDVKH